MIWYTQSEPTTHCSMFGNQFNIFRYSYSDFFFFFFFISSISISVEAMWSEEKKRRTKRCVEREKEEAGNNENMNNMLKLYKRVCSFSLPVCDVRFKKECRSIPSHRCVSQERKQTVRLSNSHICCAAILRCFWCRCHFVSFPARAHPQLLKIESMDFQAKRASILIVRFTKFKCPIWAEKNHKTIFIRFEAGKYPKTNDGQIQFGFWTFYVCIYCREVRFWMRPECCERQARRNKKPNLTETATLTAAATAATKKLNKIKIKFIFRFLDTPKCERVRTCALAPDRNV